MAQLENFRLKVFRTVAQQLSFRKAAEHLFLTQPAVTLQIKALEEDLGVRLFNRDANRISLTPQGALLLRFANRIATLVAEAEEKLSEQDGKLSGELSLGVSTTIAQYVLPWLIGAFLSEHPRVHFSLRSGNTSEIVQLVVEEKVAIGLIEGPARERGVRLEPFMRDELVLIAAPEFAFPALSTKQLLRENLLMREQGSGSRRVVETALEEAGLRLKSFARVIELDSTEAIKSAVEAGLGMGFVSRWSVAKELELGTLKIVEVAGLHITRHFSLVFRIGPEPQGPAGVFRSFAAVRGQSLSGPGRAPRGRAKADKRS